MTAPPSDPVADSGVVATGVGSSGWRLAQVSEGARFGRKRVMRRRACIGSGVVTGDNGKVPSFASVYPGAIGSVGSLKSDPGRERVGATVEPGATIGARATCVPSLRIGEWPAFASGEVMVKGVRRSPLLRVLHTGESDGSGRQMSRGRRRLTVAAGARRPANHRSRQTGLSGRRSND